MASKDKGFTWTFTKTYPVRIKIKCRCGEEEYREIELKRLFKEEFEL